MSKGKVIFTLKPRQFPGGKMTLDEAIAWFKEEELRLINEGKRLAELYLQPSFEDTDGTGIWGHWRRSDSPDKSS